MSLSPVRAMHLSRWVEGNFISASANVDKLDPEADGLPIVLERRDDVEMNCIMSNSFGFGGTNASLVFERLDA